MNMQLKPNETAYVVYITETNFEDNYFFEKSHHYSAKLEGEKVSICAELSRGEKELIDQKYFEENFIIISEEEYAEYCNNGDIDLIDTYLDNLDEKYNVQLR